MQKRVRPKKNVTNVPGQIADSNVKRKAVSIKEQHRDELQSLLRKYRELYDLSPAGYFTLEPNGLISEVNLSGALLLGKERSAIVGCNITEFLTEEEKDGFHNYLERLFAFNVKISCESVLKSNFMPFLHVHMDGMVVETGAKCLLVVSDVTERVKAEEENRKLAMIADLTTSAIVFINTSGHVDWVNKGFEKLSGYTKAEIAGKYLLDFFNDAGANQETIAQLETCLENKSACTVELLRYNKNKQSYWVEFEMVPIHNNPGIVTGFMVTENDITDRKKEEAELLTINKNLEKKATELVISNEELERFAYVASHDLQEPLRMVSSFMKLLKKNYQPTLDEKANQYIQFAVNGADRMKQLIMDLLEYSRVGSRRDDFELTDMNDVLAEVARLYQGESKEEGPVIDFPVLPSIQASKIQMIQLFQNLVGNAIKYNSNSRPLIDIGFIVHKDHYLFSVTDNGIGIAAKHFPKIFTLFQRLHIKEEYPGTGVGLAICKKIVDRHKGSIWLESKPGKGSTFFFTIEKQPE